LSRPLKADAAASALQPTSKRADSELQASGIQDYTANIGKQSIANGGEAVQRRCHNTDRPVRLNRAVAAGHSLAS
jgi:hypothetical protein